VGDSIEYESDLSCRPLGAHLSDHRGKVAVDVELLSTAILLITISTGGNHSSERKDKNEYNGRAFVPSSSARSRQLEGYQ
jgi:hypothetical protein